MSFRLVNYSEAFKRRVVEELERGDLVSVEEARRRYGIGGSSTVSSWLRKYGKNHLLAKVVRVETSDERTYVARLKRENEELRRAMVDAQVQSSLDRSYLQILAEQHGITDLDELKKNSARSCSALSRQRLPAARGDGDELVHRRGDDSAGVLQGSEGAAA